MTQKYHLKRSSFAQSNFFPTETIESSRHLNSSKNINQMQKTLVANPRSSCRLLCYNLTEKPKTVAMSLPGVCLNILQARQEKNGSSSNPEKFLDQDYQQLKQYCLIRNLRYVDDMFPPDKSSIGTGLLSPSDLDRVEWLRPMVSAAGEDLQSYQIISQMFLCGFVPQ